MNYPDLLANIMANGKVIAPRKREIREIVKARLEIHPYVNIYAWPAARSIEKIEGYLWKELAWYMSGNRDAQHIAQFAGMWDKIKNPDGSLNSNYGHLVFYNRTRHPSLGDVCATPFEWARSCLLADQDSRQAVITYNTGGFNFAGNDDYICTQHQSFLIRDGLLRCFIALRSSDAIFGLTFNMPWWSLVHQQLWRSLREQYPGLRLGSIEIDIYSAHIYAHHYKLVEDMLREKPERYWLGVERAIPIGAGGAEWYQNHIREFVKIRSQEAAKCQ